MIVKNPLFQSVLSLFRQMRDGEIQILASSLAFGTLVSIVPFLAVSLSVFYTVGGLESFLLKVEPFLLHNLVPSSVADIAQVIRHSVERIHSGALGATGVVALLIISTKIFFDIEYAVQKIWQLKNPRSFTLRVFIYWLVLFLVPVAVAAMLGFFGSHDFKAMISLPKGSLKFLFALISIFSINKFMPAVRVQSDLALLSSLVATCTISVLQLSYATLTKKIFMYNNVYGGLASVPIFLLWVLLLWWIILASVAVCANLHKQID